MPVLRFPDGFLWGAATAAYQIEGSPLADGAGASIWHTFSHEAGRIEAGDTGDRACDHYHRREEDLRLMQELGLQAYRFSVSWPRVLPQGHGPINPAGLSFYSRLADGLLEAGIEPFVTLYHWDLPQALEDRGGWPARDAPRWFADYAARMFEALGDRVKRWITFNEPWVFTWLGYAEGFHAPGRTDREAALAAAHNVLLGHGLAVGRFRELVRDGEIGITLSVQDHQPAGDDQRDVAAVERSAAFHNEWFIEPIVHADYPALLKDAFGESLPAMSTADAGVISRPIDFVGLNYYTRNVIVHDDDAFLNLRPLGPIGQYTEMGWEVYPAGLYNVLTRFHARYGLPLYVTENGAAFNDPPVDDRGRIADWERLRYLQSHFEMAHRAIGEGVELCGYFAWSLLDNFEWTFGYSKRFGLIACDFDSGARTVKESGRWYRQVIENNGI